MVRHQPTMTLRLAPAPRPFSASVTSLKTPFISCRPEQGCRLGQPPFGAGNQASSRQRLTFYRLAVTHQGIAIRVAIMRKRLLYKF